MIKCSRVALSALAFSVAAFAAADQLYVEYADAAGAYHVGRYTVGLSSLGSTVIGGNIRGLAAGASGTFYVGLNFNTVAKYSDNGTLLASITGGGATVEHDVAYNGSVVYCSYDASGGNGVAQFTSDVAFVNDVGAPGYVSALAAADPGSFYAGVSNTVFRVTDGGSVLSSISASSTTVLHDLAYKGSTVFASLSDGSLNAVARFDANLGFQAQFALGQGNIDALAAGSADGFYAATNDTIFAYDASGNVVSSLSIGAGSRIIDMSYSVGGVPEPASMLALGAGLAFLARSRRARQ